MSFAEMGRSEVQAQVLACVVSDGETTAADLAAATGKALSSLSVAVQRLVQLGLLQRVPGRRPSVIFLHPQAADALAGLVAARGRRVRGPPAHPAAAVAGPAGGHRGVVCRWKLWRAERLCRLLAEQALEVRGVLEGRKRHERTLSRGRG